MSEPTRRSGLAVVRELSEQLSALRASCPGYDAGHQWEAKRIATALYTLLHDGRRATIP